MIRDWLDVRRRRIDVQVLWPACMRFAPEDREKAEMAFYLHVLHDPAWSKYFSPGEMREFIREL